MVVVDVELGIENASDHICGSRLLNKSRESHISGYADVSMVVDDVLLAKRDPGKMGAMTFKRQDKTSGHLIQHVLMKWKTDRLILAPLLLPLAGE